MSPNLLQLYEGGDFSLIKNAKFVNAFVDDVVASTDRSKIYKDGALTQDGLRRVRAAILAKAYKDPSTLERMLESTDDNVKALSNGLLDAAPQFARLQDDKQIPDALKTIPESLTKAINEIAALREQGKTAAEYFDQQDMFKEEDPVRDALIKAIHNDSLDRARSQAYIKDLLSYITEGALSQQAGGLPGLENDVTAAEVIDLAEERAKRDDDARKEKEEEESKKTSSRNKIVAQALMRVANKYDHDPSREAAKDLLKAKE